MCFIDTNDSHSKSYWFGSRDLSGILLWPMTDLYSRARAYESKLKILFCRRHWCHFNFPLRHKLVTWSYTVDFVFHMYSLQGVRKTLSSVRYTGQNKEKHSFEQYVQKRFFFHRSFCGFWKTIVAFEIIWFPVEIWSYFSCFIFISLSRIKTLSYKMWKWWLFGIFNIECL